MVWVTTVCTISYENVHLNLFNKTYEHILRTDRGNLTPTACVKKSTSKTARKFRYWKKMFAVFTLLIKVSAKIVDSYCKIWP